MSNLDLKKRTKAFAHRCVKAALSLPENKLGGHISRQLIRSSTSVAANYRAVCLAHSTAAFSSKLSIVIEEVDESEFWLDFALDENLFKPQSVDELKKEAKELTSIFLSSRKTIQTNKKTARPLSNNQ